MKIDVLVIDLILYDNVCVCIGLIDTDNISAFSVCFQVEGLAWVVSITCCRCEKNNWVMVGVTK